MSTQSGNLRALCAHVDHRAGCGKCEICLAADQVEQLEIKNAELEKQVEMLQSGARSNIRLHADLSKVTKQRDTLLAAVKLCVPELRAWMNCHGEDLQTIAAIKTSEAAIASVKEQA